MALTIALDGNISIQLTDDARPTPVPVRFSLNYTRKAMFDYVLPALTSDMAVGPGSVTAPKFVLIWVKSGSVDFSWDSGGAAPTTISANPNPPPSDVPVMVMMRFEATTSTLYMSSTEGAVCSVWLFS